MRTVLRDSALFVAAIEASIAAQEKFALAFASALNGEAQEKARARSGRILANLRAQKREVEAVLLDSAKREGAGR